MYVQDDPQLPVFLFSFPETLSDREEPTQRVWVSHLDQLVLGREAEAVDRVGPAVGPLAELLRRLGECHVGGDGAVDNGLRRTKVA